MRIHTCTQIILVYMRVYYVCMYVRSHMYIINILTCTYAYICIHNIHIYKYIYIYIHAYIYNTYVIAYYFRLPIAIPLSVHFDDLLRPTLLEGWLNRRTETSTWGGSLRQGSYFVEFRHLQFSWSGTTKYFYLSPTPQIRLISMFM